MKKIKQYQYWSGDHTGECGAITYDKCEIVEYLEYTTMQITEKIAHFFETDSEFKKEYNKPWKRIK